MVGQSWCMCVQVHVKQEENSRKLLGKLDRKPLVLPDIEDCSKCPQSSPHTLLESWCYIKEPSPLLFSEQRDMSTVSLRALGRWAGCAELPQKAGEEAATGGANSDVCGDPSRRRGRGRVPAHTETKQRSVQWWWRELVCRNNVSPMLHMFE